MDLQLIQDEPPIDGDVIVCTDANAGTKPDPGGKTVHLGHQYDRRVSLKTSTTLSYEESS
jgi:hypothetical protein